jgi:hypothetical protein
MSLHCHTAGNESNSSYFEDISLDPTDSTLYLTSKSSRQILAVSAELPGDSPRHVLDTGDMEPSGIAVDPCTRWAPELNYQLSAIGGMNSLNK